MGISRKPVNPTDLLSNFLTHVEMISKQINVELFVLTLHTNIYVNVVTKGIYVIGE